MSVTFFIDEDSLSLHNVDPSSLPALLTTLADLLATIATDGTQRFKKSSVYEAPISDDFTLTDVLFYDGGPLDHDVHLLLMLQFDSTPDWDATAHSLLSSRTKALETLSQGSAAACVVALPYCSRNVAVFQSKKLILHSVGTVDQLIDFYRDAPELGNFDPELYVENAHRAFRGLYFKPGICSEFRRFQEPYQSIRPKITQALAGLNDHLHRIRIESNDDANQIMQRFRSIAHFEISPESPNTHKNRKAMKRREIEIANRSFCCEWHVKIRPTTDRIHFHFGAPDFEGGRIVIGIFCDHLET